MTLSIEKALERGDAVVERSAESLECLQPHDKLVSPVLRFIRLHVLRGVDDEAWYDEQLNFLERMLVHRDNLIERIDALDLIRTSTRREIFRRISLATDYLHSNYRQPIDLESLGKAACLSKFHFLRLFTRVHGITPHQYLLRKRAKTALRLLQTTPLDVCEIASSIAALHNVTLCYARCAAGPASRHARFAAPNRFPRSSRQPARQLDPELDSHMPLMKKGSGVAAPPPLIPIVIATLELHGHANEDVATEGVVHLRKRVAVARSPTLALIYGSLSSMLLMPRRTFAIVRHVPAAEQIEVALVRQK